MRKALCISVVVMSLAGCVTNPPQTVLLTKPYDAEQAKSLLVTGENKIVGSALVRQNGGGVVTCAGNTVHLVPATDYAIERLWHIYHSEEKGFSRNRFKFEPDYPEYKENTRTALCDSQGMFEFSNVADGDFIVSTVISWTVRYSTEGGALFSRVKVENGETKKVVLAP